VELNHFAQAPWKRAAWKPAAMESTARSVRPRARRRGRMGSPVPRGSEGRLADPAIGLSDASIGLRLARSPQRGLHATLKSGGQANNGTAGQTGFLSRANPVGSTRSGELLVRRARRQTVRKNRCAGRPSLGRKKALFVRGKGSVRIRSLVLGHSERKIQANSKRKQEKQWH
jgi:hypothetical protein